MCLIRWPYLSSPQPLEPRRLLQLDISNSNANPPGMDSSSSERLASNPTLKHMTIRMLVLIGLGASGCTDRGQSGSPSGSCCKYCQTGCACGDSCIPCSFQCHQPDGCACNGTPGTTPGEEVDPPWPEDGICPNDECATEYPSVPQCWIAQWNPEKCRCELLARESGPCAIEADLCRLGSCSAGVCEMTAAVRDCSDEVACTIEWCEPKVGCVSEEIAALCEDSLGCTFDTCEAGVGCKHVAQPELCNDGNTCTFDECLITIGCTNTPDDLFCDDGNACTNDRCDLAVGCQHSINAGPCDDGNSCTVNDVCAEGLCLGGAAIVCNDDNPCTTDSCHFETGCRYDHAESSCDDGSVCTQDDRCIRGFCSPGTVIDCDDGNSCTDDSCTPLDGCLHHARADGSLCTDGNLCIIGDRCSDGACVGGEIVVVCDDANECTDDSCIPQLGCQYAPNQQGCSDGDPCTIDDTCESGVCMAYPSVWIQQIGTQDVVRAALALLSADDGQTIVAGGVQNGVTQTVDPWLASVDDYGRTVWERSYPEPTDQAINASVRDLCSGHGGGFVLLSGAIVQGRSQQALVIRTTPGGEELWRRDIGHNGLDHGWAVLRHSLGGYLVGGWSTQATRLAWLVRLDAVGNVVWDKFYGSGEIRDLVELTGGEVLALGGTDNSVVLRVIDGLGEVVRSKQFPVQTGGISTIQLVRTGADFVLGGTVSEPSQGERVWLRRVDANLEEVWERRFSASDMGSDRMNGIAILVDQSIGFAAQSLRSGGSNGSHWDGWLAHVDGLGNLLRSKTLGTTGFDSLNALLPLSSEHLLVAGEANAGNGNDRHALLLKVDGWGNWDCAEAGACATLSLATCDDDNPCTVDTCVDGRCSSTNLQDGAPCDGLGRSCSGGFCTSDE